METGVSASSAQHAQHWSAYSCCAGTSLTGARCCRASANADLLQGKRFYKCFELALEAGKTAHPEYCFEGMEIGVDRVDKLLVWLARMVGAVFL